MDDQDRKLDSFYSSKDWKATRKAYFVRNPLCEHCDLNGVLKSGDVVDHIVERRDGGSDHDFSNLQTLCHACHNRKSAEERLWRNR